MVLMLELARVVACRHTAWARDYLQSAAMANEPVRILAEVTCDVHT